MANYTGKGCFKKGVSGNPGGRPKLPAEMREIFQSRGLEAAEILVKHLHASDPRVSVAAAREILDRAYGKPVQSINVDREERIKLIAVVPQKAATTEEWLKLVERENPNTPRDVIEGYAREIEALPNPRKAPNSQEPEWREHRKSESTQIACRPDTH